MSLALGESGELRWLLTACGDVLLPRRLAGCLSFMAGTDLGQLVGAQCPPFLVILSHCTVHINISLSLNGLNHPSSWAWVCVPLPE